MHIKKIITVVLMASMLCTACTGKKQEKKSEEPVQAETLPSEEEADKKPDENTAVTKDSFRSFPVSDESIFGFDVVEGGLEISGCKRDVADKVIIRKMSTDMTINPLEAIVKTAKKESLYEALDIACAWLRV